MLPEVCAPLTATTPVLEMCGMLGFSVVMWNSQEACSDQKTST